MRRKLIGIALLGASGVAAVLTALGGEAARATTGNNTGLPDPPVEVSRHIGTAFEGRYYLEKVPRKANILGAVMDILLINEDVPPFYFGKIYLRNYNSAGTTEIQELALWWFDYHRQDNRLTARLIPPASVSESRPDGEQIGTISFEVPGGRTGLSNGGHELQKLKNATITLNKRGTYSTSFYRGGGPSVEEAVITKIPAAKRYGL